MRNKHGNALKGIFYIVIVSLIVVTIVYFLLNQQGDEVDSSPTVVSGDRQIDLLEGYITLFDDPNYVTVEDYYKIEEKVRRLKWKRKYNHRQKVYEEKLKNEAIIDKKIKKKKDKLLVEIETKEKEKQLAEKKDVDLQALAKEETKKNKGNWKMFEVTAYSAHAQSTGKSVGDKGFGLTASGDYVRPFHTLACPSHFEFGTKIYIPEMGNTYTCEDRGSKIVFGRLDIYMKSQSKAMSFGRNKNMKVKILN